jgi:DNA invertase Pin-like site-specific DNA recombinase
MSTTRRAIGIIRVSDAGGRKGESFTSPKTQRQSIEQECEREGLTLLDCFEEIDVSGGKALEDRPRLLEAVRMVEAGEADVIVAAYFDRLVRSLKTQTELLERVEAAGGKVRAVDAGDISAGTSGEWLDSTMRGMMAEYQRRQVIERVRPAMERMIARGVSAGASVPAGYLRPRAEDGSPLPFVIDAETAPVIRQVFEARAAGASYPQLCRMPVVWAWRRRRGPHGWGSGHARGSLRLPTSCSPATGSARSESNGASTNPQWRRRRSTAISPRRWT